MQLISNANTEPTMNSLQSEYAILDVLQPVFFHVLPQMRFLHHHIRFGRRVFWNTDALTEQLCVRDI